jgi:hypothetical protein
VQEKSSSKEKFESSSSAQRYDNVFEEVVTSNTPQLLPFWLAQKKY